MIYKDFQDIKLSALGLGTMRLPLVNGSSEIDEAAAGKLVDLAMEQGINYYDTAWGYHSGNSELVMGRLLGRYPRELLSGHQVPRLRPEQHGQGGGNL